MTELSPRPVIGTQKICNEATITTVAGSTSSGTIIAANPKRLGLLIYNDSSAILYLRYGTGTAVSTDMSVPIGANTLFEEPSGYQGAITGVWASAAGTARITELT